MNVPNIKGQTVITDFVTAKANGTSNSHIKNVLRNLHTADEYCVILPKAMTKYVCGLYNISLTTKDLMSGDDGSAVYDLYKEASAVVIASSGAEVKKKD